MTTGEGKSIFRYIIFIFLFVAGIFIVERLVTWIRTAAGDREFFFIFIVLPLTAAVVIKIFLLKLLKNKAISSRTGSFILIVFLESLGSWMYISFFLMEDLFFLGTLVYLTIFPFINILLLKEKAQGYPCITSRIKEYLKAALLSIIIPLILLLSFVALLSLNNHVSFRW